MNQLLALTRKELKAYFGSPMAAIFIGAFLMAALFSFFWVETFFARNLADVRPLFRWMPLLLLFLVAALTMRQWSEEQRAGTLEVLLTLPVRLRYLVLGKFLAVLALVAVALALTLGLPVTVAILGNLDWGPVLGGYLGALLVAAAYIAIGLFVSSRTDNQIVALIATVLLAGLFYLVGSPVITDFVGNRTGELLRALGTGSRFASIERGVFDLRDLVYYLGLAGFFLAANVLALDQKRWSGGESTRTHRRAACLTALLLGANILALNLWLAGHHTLRADLTADREYSISPATRDLISNLQEPLLLRGYFSSKTHPLLAPLIPRIKDMMEEYRVASGGKIEVEFVDPRENEAVEAEANRQYGIKPVPFQVAGHNEAAVVNSYFHILVKYGDQFQTLGFDDLIEVERRPDGELAVNLRNLEYDLTKAIKKTVYGFQSLASVLARSNRQFTLTLVATPKSLPPSFAGLPAQIATAAAAVGREAGGRLAFENIDPDQPGGPGRAEVNRRFHIQPLALSPFDHGTFYLHLFLTAGGEPEPLYLTGGMGAAEIRQEIEGAVKRNASGFLKTVGLWVPRPEAAAGMAAGTAEYRLFREMLRENYNLKDVDLTGGRVPGDIDMLLLVAPQSMTDLERLAIDQYLMRGGAVVALAGRYLLDIPPGAKTLNLRRANNGIGRLLDHYGLTVQDSLVMDTQNEPFPIPMTRNLGGGVVVQEIRQLDYPYFVDVRSGGMNRESPIVANLPAVTMNWVSPVVVNPEAASKRKVTTLLQSSPESWLSTSTDIQPDFAHHPRTGFPEGEVRGVHTLAAAMQGSFTSYFNEKNDPRKAARGKGAAGKPGETGAAPAEASLPLLRSSPDSARLVVVGSAEFLNDAVIGISQSVGKERYLNSLAFLQNIVDWAMEDEDLLTIRSRSSQARLLAPMSRQAETFWEWLNYGLALLGLALVSFAGIRRQRREKPLTLEAEAP
ncbi:MAG: Gldg family protein [Desulfobacteraceae bacterium]|nr:Gldg family protein [Desulfobacteraceae bacterium]